MTKQEKAKKIDSLVLKVDRYVTNTFSTLTYDDWKKVAKAYFMLREEDRQNGPRFTIVKKQRLQLVRFLRSNNKTRTR